MQEAIRLCLDYALHKHNRSVARVAELMGVTEWVVYRWMSEGSLPSKRIRPFEFACDATFVTRYIVMSASQVVIYIPAGRACDQSDLLDLQNALNDSVALRTQFYRGEAEAMHGITHPLRQPHGFLLCFLAVLLAIAFPGLLWAYEPPDGLIFGGDSAYPPFEWLEEGAPSGFNIDLAKAIAQTTGLSVDYRLGHWPATISALQGGDIHVVAMFSSEQRQDQFLFTSPFHYVAHAIYASEDGVPVYSVNNLAGRRVAVEKLSFAHQQFQIEGIDAELVLTSSTPEALRVLAAQGAEFAVLSAPVADHLIQERELPLKKLGPPVWSRPYVFAVRKDLPELHQWLQRSLTRTIESGRYQAIYDGWQSELEPRQAHSTVVLRYVKLGFGALALLVAMIITWSWSLRRKALTAVQDLKHTIDRARSAELQAKHLTNFDTDTGFAKPDYFLDLLSQELQHASPSGEGNELLMLKLVELDEIVGSLGKRFSDELIRDLVDGISGNTRGLCGYFGRGIFSVFASRSDIRALIAALSHQRPSSRRYYIAGGSARYPDHGCSSWELEQHAEMAMAVASSRQESWLVYDPSMEPDPLDLEIAASFRENRVDGMHAVFQPQQDLKTGCINAVEALVRWNHPTYGVIPPARFIPLIEKAGHVSTVTGRMLDEAAGLVSRFRQEGFSVSVSVNIAVHDLVAADLPQRVRQTLNRHGVAASDLKLELTETSFASDSKRVRESLLELNQLGVSLSIDDFGTGYSSLSYLSLFPVQELKIDREFVGDMARNPKHRCIVRSTITMAHELGLRTVAEGAEDDATMRALVREGCDCVQGYVISRPLPEPELLEFLRQREKGALTSASAVPLASSVKADK